MKLLKKFLFLILAIIALWLIAALFIDGNFTVVRSVEISRSNDEVFDYIKYLKNQSEYSAWAEMDPYMDRNYEGTDGEVGFVSAWKSDSANVGVGEQEIIGVEEGVRIDYELRFKEPDEMNSKAYMSTEDLGGNLTKVDWGFKGKIPYPFNVMKLFINFDEQLGPDLEKGLNNLKELLEEKPAV